MKIREDLRNLTTTQSNLAKALGLTQPRINQLIDEEIVVRDEQDTSGAVKVFESVKNFYLSKNSVATGGVDYWKERGLHERAKRQMAELKVSQAEGELYFAADVEAVMIEQLTNFRNKLLGLPAKFAVRLEGKNREEINEMLTEEIENCLEELANNYSLISNS